MSVLDGLRQMLRSLDMTPDEPIAGGARNPMESRPAGHRSPVSGTTRGRRTHFLDGCDLDGNRWNDKHDSNVMKRATRALAESRQP